MTSVVRRPDQRRMTGCSLPPHLAAQNMHLDPDFEHLTYGDRGTKGKQLSTTLQRDDLLVFYSRLRDARAF